MSIITLKNEAKEGGSYTIEFKFRDEDSILTIPETLNWTLTDVNGNVVNNRKEVSIDSEDLNSTMNITLNGADLPAGWKILTINGTYDSDYGTGLILRDSVKFYVRDLIYYDQPDLIESITTYVTSIFGRSGNVISQTGDYTWNQIDKTISDINDITNKSHNSLTDIGLLSHSEIETSLSALSGLVEGFESGNVASVFGRSGIVTSENNDYTWNQIDKTISDIADISDKSHISLTDIGTLTHDEIEDELNDINSNINYLSGNIGDVDFSNINSDINYLSASIDEKSDLIHNHDDLYYTETEINNLLSPINSNISDNYNLIQTNTNNISDLINDTQFLSASIDDKSDIGHSHDDLYYTETEIDNLLNDKADITTTDELSAAIDNIEITYDGLLSTNLSYAGPTFNVIVGESVSFGDSLYINRTDGKWYKGLSDDEATIPVMNMSVENKNADEICKVLDDPGIIRNDDWNWNTDNVELYLDHNIPGGLSETPPISGGYFGQVVAIIMESNKIKFKPSSVIIKY